jgi:hypothetical protein
MRRLSLGCKKSGRWLLAALIVVLTLVGLADFKTIALAQTDDTGQPYLVQPGDTLFLLASKYLGDGHRFPEIIAATQAKHAADPSFAAIDDPNVIHVGSKLWIPPAAVPVDAPLPTLASVAAPTGKIAFSFWNNAPERCVYEINIIDVTACLAGPENCQAHRQIFPLRNASEPALSPDGSRLAFRGWGGYPEKTNNEQDPHPYANCPGPFPERQLGHTTPDGINYYRLGGFWEDSHPDWSPDGQRLLFDTARNGDGITRIMAISADGQREDTLRLAGQFPSWAPDNDRFVYRGCDLTGNRCGLWLARAVPVEAWDVGTNLLAPVLTEPEATQPDWSPLGEQIVYQSPAGGSWDIYRLNVDGSDPQQLTRTPASEGLPVWSPDGQWLAYLSDEGGNWGLWLMRPDGTASRQLFAFDGGTFSPLPVPPFGPRDWLDEQISWSP